MSITIKNYTNNSTGENLIGVFTPYSALFVDKAKKLGGKWGATNKCWLFKASNRSHVEALLDEVFGEHGQGEAGDYARVRISVPEGGSAYKSGFEVGGIALCYATGRDSGAKLSDGVICLEGGYSGGGSVKNWRTIVDPGSVFEVTVPRLKAEALTKVEMAGEGNLTRVTCEIVLDEQQRQPDREALQAERRRLSARLVEIADLLGESP